MKEYQFLGGELVIANVPVPSQKVKSEANLACFLHKEPDLMRCFVVVGFNPFEKYDRQIGSFPKVRDENSKNV